MKRVGNTANNKTYNPKNVHPAMPIDVDEVDGAMERFIRQKYEHRNYSDGANRSNATSPGSRQNTGSTSSEERATLPPKPNKRFFFPSLRSASSTVPRQGTISPPISPGYDVYGERSPKENKKHSKFLGTSVAHPRDDALERKIQHLKDMGFLNEKKNAQVLKGFNGNVDKAVETLLRLGEGTNHNQEARNQSIHEGNARNALPTPRATPVNGITVQKSRESVLPPAQSNNPFDRQLDTNKTLPPPPSSPTDRSISPPQSQAYNPFGQPAQHFAQPSQQPSIDQAFSNMSIGQQAPQQPPQQLFPNMTGGYSSQNQAAYNPFMQQMAAPPVPQVPQQYSQFTPPTSTNLPQQQFAPQAQAQAQPHPQHTDPTPNPFLRTSRSQNFNPSNPFDTQGPFNAYSATPQQNFGLQPQQTGMQTTSYGMQQQYAQAPQQQMNTQSQSNSYNPFQASNPQSQSVFGGGVSASPAGTPYGQPGGQQGGNSYPFGQPAASSPTYAQNGNASNPFGQQSGASSPYGPPQGSSPFFPQQQAAAAPFGQSNGNSLFNQSGLVQEQSGYQQSAPDVQFQAPQAPYAQQPYQGPSSAPPQQQSMFQPPQQYSSQPPPQSQFPQRHDKTSILSLYNMPQLAPQRPADQQYQNTSQVQDFAQQPTQHSVPQRSVTMPVSPPHHQAPNPFASLAPKPSALQNSSAFAGVHGQSRESVDFAGLAMMSGRHSPDAFSGLSARMR